MRKDVVIVGAYRTAVGNFGGSLSQIDSVTLGTKVVEFLLQKLAVNPNQVDEVIMGQVLQAGSGQNAARQIAISAGLPITTPAITINRVCGSGMNSVHYATQSIVLNDADTVVAGGVENMSMSPHLLIGSRSGQRLGDWHMKDSMLIDSLTCNISHGIHMGITAENLANQYHISRQEQDAYALASQHKATLAMQSGAFAQEIVPISIPQRKGDPVIFNQDEFIKPHLNEDKLAKLRPAFIKDGTVTAANASGINDGAAVLLLMSAQKAAELGLKPLVRVVAYASVGVEPTTMGIGPVAATKKCLKKAGWSLQDLDVIESNEAFAAQSIAVNKELGWDTTKVNLRGGAIALGHPIGASGCRILTTLIHIMQQRGLSKGLATMCIGGGQGIATALELI